MKPRSHSLNHVVCVTMTAIDAVPTTRVQRNATTWRDRRAADTYGSLRPNGLVGSRAKARSTSVTCSNLLESLADAEVDAPLAALGLAVDAQPVDGCQLIPE